MGLPRKRKECVRATLTRGRYFCATGDHVDKASKPKLCIKWLMISLGQIIFLNPRATGASARSAIQFHICAAPHSLARSGERERGILISRARVGEPLGGRIFQRAPVSCGNCTRTWKYKLSRGSLAPTVGGKLPRESLYFPVCVQFPYKIAPKGKV